MAPACNDRWGIGDAFRQSLVWRAYKSFSEDTRRELSKLSRTEHDQRDTLDVLLTVATLPEHPLNAWFLDRRLRKDTMPDRDAWWSVYLHHAYRTEGAVDRLVDWASSLRPSISIDAEAVDLCAVALSWMLTASNRFLRDRATTALVNLLTGRVTAVTRLVDRFSDVDDPYVAERIYAVAYGVAMRCHDPVTVGALAKCVYERVFASGSPTPHILLRDYARGVVERALHLGSTIDIVSDRVRPPYKSTWPTMPTEEEIETLLPDWSKGSHDSRDLQWAWNRIGSSVMTDDFASYVIGTNHSQISWLSLKLEDPLWNPPPRHEDLLRPLVAEFSTDELTAWEKFEAAERAHMVGSWFVSVKWVAQQENDDTPQSLDPSGSKDVTEKLDEARAAEVAELKATLEQARVALGAALSDEHAERLAEIYSARQENDESRLPPMFNLPEIQRYVLWRVFDLGWTIERFGRFDRFSIGYRGRDASKAERIGKKYQWIAYHEILAFISDHYQYKGCLREEDGDQKYEGPWQDNFRNIDPSSTLRSLPGGNYSWDGHAESWWAPTRYDSWGDPIRPRDWVLNTSDLPRVEDLLVATNPADGSRWVNGECSFTWVKQPPADQKSTDVERLELWYMCTGYLVGAADAEAFLQWAEQIDHAADKVPDAASTYDMFLGEHAWAPASEYYQQPYYGDSGWTQPTDGCPVKLQPVTRKYVREEGGFDCSIDEGYMLRLPSTDLVSGLGIHWTGHGADFTDSTGQVVAQDPAAHSAGPSAMLFRDALLGEYLARENLTICWAVRGQKRVIPPPAGVEPHHPWLRLSGVFVLSAGRPVGFLKHMIDNRDGRDGLGKGLKVVSIVRTAR